MKIYILQIELMNEGTFKDQSIITFKSARSHSKPKPFILKNADLLSKLDETFGVIKNKIIADLKDIEARTKK